MPEKTDRWRSMKMDEKLLKKLLRERKEQDWFDFKSSLKLYQSDGKLVDKQRDELLKDILGMANGNSHIIRKTKYLVIGADNNQFDEHGVRVLHSVDYKVPSRSDLAKWLGSASTVTIAGLDCELVPYQGANLFVISIPPTFDLHETTRELVTSNGSFHKYTVFMRQDEHTVPASVRDGLTIQQLKQLHRQEIANPPSLWIGAIAGGLVALIVGSAKINVTQTTQPISDGIAQIIFFVMGAVLGIGVGWMGREYNETRYDWRYMTRKQRFLFFIVFGVLSGFLYLLFR